MVRKVVFLALFLLVGTAFLNSCKKEELSSKKEILSFFFEASKNDQLDRNFFGDINGTNLSAEVAFGVDITRLIPTIEISPRATLSPAAGVATDFSGPVIYTVTAEDKTTKTFTAGVMPEPAPYLGSWTGGPIDFGMGLMRIHATMNEDGEITLEFLKILTGEKDGYSIKGYFEPLSRQNTEIRINQTQRWINNNWNDEEQLRTFMYQVITPQNLKLYYCLSFPRNEWCFQINLTKE